MIEEIYCFGGNPLDRVSEKRRDAQWVQSLLAEPATRILPLQDLKPLIRNGGEMVLDWHEVAPWRDRIASGAALILLGLADGRAHFAIDAGSDRPHGIRDSEAMDARTAASGLSEGEAAMLAEARSVLDWHARHPFCAQCGNASLLDSAGWGRHCPSCKASHHPRVDPVVIMLAIRGDHCLLGRNGRRAGSRYSCLAGFMEPGETLEEAVRREVHEEAGIEIGRVRYLASQPWPFPSTLMMGFLAEAISEEITIDTTELADARWFSRDEALTMLERARGGDTESGVTLPAPMAIAHQIIRRWATRADTL